MMMTRLAFASRTLIRFPAVGAAARFPSKLLRPGVSLSSAQSTSSSTSATTNSGDVLGFAKLATVRYMATTIEYAQEQECPTAAIEHPELKCIPSWPCIGSNLKMDQTKIFEFWPDLYRKYGAFYSIGIPGLGAGLSGTCHVLQDPNEMAKILRREGKYPSGAAEFSWAIGKFYKGCPIGAFFGRGPEWKRMRNFIQNDLLHPTSAARYAPGVLQSARACSRGVPAYSDRMNEYTNIASFEMFSTAMLGQQPGIIDPTAGETDPRHLEFCKAVAIALGSNSKLMLSASDGILCNLLGYKTSEYRNFEQNWSICTKIARELAGELYERRLRNQLTATEENSYINHAFTRYENESEKTLTLDDVKTLIEGLLAAGVDTTGGTLTWRLLHVALSENTQERIHDELTAAMKKHNTNNMLTPECISPKEAPWLHAAVRESHRLANVSITIPMKILQEPIEVHGTKLPAKSVVMLDTLSTGLRPDFVGDRPFEFDPSRFLPEAVQARKGTPAGILDHPFFHGPFSQGARKCPGSRIANLEIVSLLSQLILDWKISVPNVKHWKEIPYSQRTLSTAQLPKMEFTRRT